MKVGVITFHNVFNYGASLQTWALQKILRKLDAEAYVIHYHPQVIDDLYDPVKCVGIKRIYRLAILKYKNRERFDRYSNYKKFIKSKFHLLGNYTTYEELKGAGLKLDAYITGSDQVWNSQHTGGFDPSYFLDFAEEGAKRIAYAASIGRNYVVPTEKELIRKSLSRFDAISVREHSAKPVIEELTDTPVQVVLDPTLLLEKKEYEEIIVRPGIKEEYIFVYMLEHDKELIQFADRISKALGLPIIQREMKEKFKNETGSCYTKGPGEFLGMIEGAGLVLTNSFHGTVFSIIYQKPFLSMLHPYTGSRTIDLLNMLHLESHIISEPDKFCDIRLAEMKDTKKLEQNLFHLRQLSIRFLGRALGKYKKQEKVECPADILKEECYGCHACKESCPVNAITMEADEEGFLYPVANPEICTNCQVCSRVCIKNHPKTIEYQAGYPQAFLGINTMEETRISSSSGGIFPVLAEYVISKGGHVAGVKWDEDMRAVSVIVNTLEDLKPLYGSKYVKSDFSQTFSEIKKLLKSGEIVLFSGLPCEGAALRAYLKKEYSNLLICEILCHAAPSPKVLENYVAHLNKKYQSKVNELGFRDKSTGWETYKCSMVIGFESGKRLSVKAKTNNYFRAFQKDLISRPSCSSCHYVYDKRAGDFTIGDYWGGKLNPSIDPAIYDGKGTSMILVNNEKAMNVWNQLGDNIDFRPTDVKTAFVKNHQKPIPYILEREDLFKRLEQEPIDQVLGDFNDNPKKNK